MILDLFPAATGAEDASHTTWWDEAFPRLPYQRKPPGENQMLILLAYDITCPKRLAKVAKTCEDYGVRVQYSLFECHLTPETLDELWLRLLYLINEDEDRIVAYSLDSRSASKTLSAGTMVCSQKVVCYLC